jgi:hypothetical protein
MNGARPKPGFKPISLIGYKNNSDHLLEKRLIISIIKMTPTNGIKPDLSGAVENPEPCPERSEGLAPGE